MILTTLTITAQNIYSTAGGFSCGTYTNSTGVPMLVAFQPRITDHLDTSAAQQFTFRMEHQTSGAALKASFQYSWMKYAAANTVSGGRLSDPILLANGEKAQCFIKSDAAGDTAIDVSVDVIDCAAVNLARVLNTALTETSTGYLAAAFKKFLDVASPTGTVNSLPAATAGTTGGLALLGDKMNLVDALNGVAVTAIQNGLATTSGLTNVNASLRGNLFIFSMMNYLGKTLSPSRQTEFVKSSAGNTASAPVLILDPGFDLANVDWDATELDIFKGGDLSSHATAATPYTDLSAGSLSEDAETVFMLNVNLASGDLDTEGIFCLAVKLVDADAYRARTYIVGAVVASTLKADVAAIPVDTAALVLKTPTQPIATDASGAVPASNLPSLDGLATSDSLADVGQAVAAIPTNPLLDNDARLPSTGVLAAQDDIPDAPDLSLLAKTSDLEPISEAIAALPADAAPTLESITQAFIAALPEPVDPDDIAAAVAAHADFLWLFATSGGNSVRSADGSTVTFYARADTEHVTPLGQFIYDKSGDEHLRTVGEV